MKAYCFSNILIRDTYDQPIEDERVFWTPLYNIGTINTLRVYLIPHLEFTVTLYRL